MSSIVIAEKPSQARLYLRTVGRSYGEVLAASGHLFELEKPEKVNPDWAIWSDVLLVPESGFYPNVLKDDPDARKRFQKMTQAAKSADTIYLATDPDREGEGIAQNILCALREKGFKGRAMRVLPLGEDKISVEKAFASARPIEEFRMVYLAFQARSQGDQIFNLSLTRAATTLLNSGSRGVISVGRVITPTFGIVCRREEEITSFKAQDYFVPSIIVEGEAGRVALTASSSAEDRIFDRKVAEEIRIAAASFRGPISVSTQAKKETPPLLFSMSSLQVACSGRWKWSANKTAECLQDLYSKHEVVTYPRSSEVSLPEAEIANVAEMKRGIEGLFGAAGFEPQIRKKQGAFSDKDLEGASHYAIVPNVNTVGRWSEAFDAMTPEEKGLFELIARRYLSMLGPDRSYDSTTMSVKPAAHVFRATGTVERDPGWKRALGADSSPTEAKGDGADLKLPPFRDGDQVACVAQDVTAKQTTPPSRLTEGSLIELMINSWKLIDDEQEAAVLKKTKGIGTSATRQGILANLQHRGLVQSAGGKLTATPAGMALYNLLRNRAPMLLDVANTARMEMALNQIEKGAAEAKATVSAIAQQADKAIAALRAAAASAEKIDVGGSRAPTPGMLKAARAKAKREGKRLPTDVAKSFDACRAYLGPINESGYPPSAKQLAFAKSIAQQTGEELPDAVLASSKFLSEWIDQHKRPEGKSRRSTTTHRRSSKRPAQPERRTAQNSDPDGAAGELAPSPKQMSFAERIARKKGLVIPSAAIVDRKELSRWIDQHA